MKNSSTLVLVGGFGFVGRNILDALAAEPAFAGLAPVVIDDLSNACPGHEALDLPAWRGGYQDQGALAFLDRVDPAPDGRIFVFLAGETRVADSKDRPLDFIEANVTDPARFVMNALRPGDRFILISTAGALFDGSFEISVDSPYCPKNFYGATKAAEEMILGKLVELRGGHFSVIRMTNVYGRHSDRKKSAIHAFTRAARDGAEVTVNGDGGQSRDFIYAGDVGRGIATLAARLQAGEPTPPVSMLGSGRSATLMEVIAAIEAASGRPLAYRKEPARALLATEPRDVIANAAEVRELLGEDVTPLAEGIRRTWAYYADRG
ncbi:NAD-dependent epimerase/dehydratase family protein [Frigidibacter sp. ROC022]|uniref:NAD-dependent epimerase/dehydratase family protein n=1 Tax=Frigidibacter sp. ROC022 TaxID=2971796 RepID=UPI00215A0E5F|nr:NAD-dependent epimerase/dehydratase family protein [Frigidibacter sp. ROC022]MCR8726823.1 NAD-dependent epimerase/dehydratase family protein [Frigidibacter sp. ROC022]